MSGPSVALGVSVGAVVAAGVYVLWGPDTRRRRGKLLQFLCQLSLLSQADVLDCGTWEIHVS